MNKILIFSFVSSILISSICMGSYFESKDCSFKRYKTIEADFFEDDFNKNALVKALEKKGKLRTIEIGGGKFIFKTPSTGSLGCLRFSFPKDEKKISHISIVTAEENVGALYFLPAFSLKIKIKRWPQQTLTLRMISCCKGLIFNSFSIKALFQMDIEWRKPLSLSVPKLIELWGKRKNPQETILDSNNKKWVVRSIKRDPLFYSPYSNTTGFPNHLANEIYRQSFSQCIKNTGDKHLKNRSFIGVLNKQKKGLYPHTRGGHKYTKIIPEILKDDDRLVTEYDPNSEFN